VHNHTPAGGPRAAWPGHGNRNARVSGPGERGKLAQTCAPDHKSEHRTIGRQIRAANRPLLRACVTGLSWSSVPPFPSTCVPLFLWTCRYHSVSCRFPATGPKIKPGAQKRAHTSITMFMVSSAGAGEAHCCDRRRPVLAIPRWARPEPRRSGWSAGRSILAGVTAHRAPRRERLRAARNAENNRYATGSNQWALRPELSVQANKAAACGRCCTSERLKRLRSRRLTASGGRSSLPFCSQS
jgi:hypothetical protein